ncbi:DNA-directed RNA polymerase subunit alpha [bacterium]|nr:DNA-directed RNA polymerase subunit alpha [bacterium]
MKWRNLLMPKEVEMDKSVSTPTFGRFKIEPFERGFGYTIGNALRRTLLSSIQGAAVVAVKIDGVQHEFDTIKGVKEDVTDIVLNLKQLIVVMHSDEPKFLTLETKKKGEITAADFKADGDIEIINKDLLIATVTEELPLKMEVLIGHGRGYVSSDAHNLNQYEIGLIPMDATFSPIIKVNYEVKDTRVGHRIDFDRLMLDVYTDGSVTPQDALGFAAKILKDHFLLFMNFEKEPFEEEEVKKIDEGLMKIRDLFSRNVEELELSVRSSNCLKAAKIDTLGELIVKSESEMLKYRNFGRKSLREITDILDGMNLHLGMDVQGIMDNDENKEEEKK